MYDINFPAPPRQVRLGRLHPIVTMQHVAEGAPDPLHSVRRAPIGRAICRES